MKIVTIIGTRPQLIKAAALSRRIAQSTCLQEVIINTGQHFADNMCKVFFDELNIPAPAYDLAVSSLTHGAMTGRMLEKIEPILLQHKPDAVLVYGDTNSTLAGALTAAKLQIPVAHVEAGLRSRNMTMPEEINRLLTDRVSQWLFCPTANAVMNLRKEGIERDGTTVINVGDVMLDAAILFGEHARRPEYNNIPDSFALATIHRAENTDNVNTLSKLVELVASISHELPVVIPLHPRTRSAMNNCGLEFNPSVVTIEPVGYLEMLWLLQKCSLVLTDSGGLQKEAFFFKRPCITLRKETEWQELVDCGCNILVGADQLAAESAFNVFRQHKDIKYDNSMYGAGKACNRIVKTLKNATA